MLLLIGVIPKGYVITDVGAVVTKMNGLAAITIDIFFNTLENFLRKSSKYCNICHSGKYACPQFADPRVALAANFAS